MLSDTDGELLAEATNKKYLLVRNDGNRSVKRDILHYNSTVGNVHLCLTYGY